MINNVSVSTSEELYDALRNAIGGETILLEGGDYGNFSLGGKSYFNITFPSTITITSADSNDLAMFTGMRLDGVSNLTIDKVAFDYTFETGVSGAVRPFQVNYSENIQITNSTFEGDLVKAGQPDPDGFGTGIGLSVRQSSDIVLEGNEFFNWTRGLVVDRVQNLVVRSNDVHDIRSDGMNFVSVQNIVIEENYLHDFKAAYNSADHRDMIQFWTSGTNTPSTDITIRNNTLDMGEGSYTQSIFMRNEAVDSSGGGKGMYYQNVLIENNVITNGHLHGITVGETDGLIIRNNSVLSAADGNNPDQSSSALWVPSIRVKADSENVVIESNATSTIQGFTDQADWAVTMNAFVQGTNPFGPGYYGDVFISSTLSGSGAHDFKAAPGGMLDNLSAGASSTLAPPSLLGSDALYVVFTPNGGNNIKVFDASLTQQLLENDGLGNGKYFWSFGDGTTATGLVVEHNFSQGGNYHVALEVKLQDGTTYAANSVVDILGTKVVSLDGTNGAFTAYSYGNEHQLSDLENIDGGAIQLGGTGTAAEIGRGALNALRGSDSMHLDFSLAGSGSGEVFRLHGSFITWVDGNGDVAFQAYSADGTSTKVTTTGANVNDGTAHNISITLEHGKLSVSVDGEAMTSAEFSGTLPTNGSWDLAFGNPWGKANFNGSISAFDVSVGDPAYIALPGEVALLEDMPVVDQPAAPEPVDAEQGTPDGDNVTAPTPTGVTNPVFADSWKLDIAGLTEKPGALKYDATVTQTDAGTVIALDGQKDNVDLGRLTQFESYDKIGFSVDFSSDTDLDKDARLVWNHLKLGLTVQDDWITVQAATADQGFKAFTARANDLGDGALHNVTVLLDTTSDRLQVLVDDNVLLDVNDTNFELAGAGGREWGWSIGTAWNRFFEGNVSNFQISNDFDFHDSQPPMFHDSLLM